MTGDKKELEYIPIKTYDVMLALPAEHPLAKEYQYPKDNESFLEIDIDVLDKEIFILVYETKFIQDICEIFLNKFCFKFGKEFVVYSTDAAIANVEAGVGVAVVLDVVAKDRYKLGKAAFFKIKGLDYKQEISLAYLKSKKLNKLEKEFIELVGSYISIL